jgi:hypothetical protein
VKPRAELILGVGVGVFLIRAYAQGHLGAFWTTLWGGKSTTAAAPTLADLANGTMAGSLGNAQVLSSSGTDPYSIPQQGGAGPASNIFGFSASSFFDYIKSGSDPNVKAQDSAGLGMYHPGDLATHDFNYGFEGNPPTVQLPVQAQFKGASNSPAWGNALVFETQSGGLFEFMHLGGPGIGGGVAALIPGHVYAAGTPVGQPATKLPVSNNWSGPHLSVITDAAGAAALGA